MPARVCCRQQQQQRGLCDSSTDGESTELRLVSQRRQRRQQLQERIPTAKRESDELYFDRNKFKRISTKQLVELTKSDHNEALYKASHHDDVDFPSDREKYLHWKCEQSKHAFRPKVDPAKTSVILFPGQGSQFVGMGRELLDFPNVLEIYKTASDVVGFDVLDLCLNGPKSELDKTVHCQVAVFVTSLAAVEKLRETKPRLIEDCITTAGFSVGEYAALVFAGVMSLEDALLVLKARAKAMQEASEQVSSGMMSVFCGRESKLGLGMEAAREFCQKQHGIKDPVCSVASYLCPEVKVVAGHQEALTFLQSHAKQLNLKRLKPLPVSGAFHTALMKSAVQPVTKCLKQVSLHEPLIPVHNNVSAMPYRGDKMIRQMLTQQIYKPVKWEQTMHIVYSRPKGENFPSTVECGPGNQLGIILKQVNSMAHNSYENVIVGYA